VTIAAGVDYLISLLVQLGVVGFLLWQGGECFNLHLLLLPLIFIWHAWFNLGLAMLLGSMNVYYRDTQHFVGVALSALFFLSPAMYDLSFVNRLAADMDPLLMNVYLLNPLAGLFTAYRWAFLPSQAFPMNPWIVTGLIWPLLFTPLAALIFKKAQRNFADYV
jgi:ABC-type polysaccharide/polyol phosphate export permease